MSLSALTKFILPPVLASAAVFSVMTVPLALIGDKQIDINFQEETLFFGKLRDVALPYVVVATGMSLGAGISAVALSGWRKSSRKSTEVEQQISQLELQLQQKEELLNEFKLSETRLQVSGLNSFLDEQASFVETNNYPTLNPRNVSQPVVSQTYQQLKVFHHNLKKAAKIRLQLMQHQQLLLLKTSLVILSQKIISKKKSLKYLKQIKRA